MMIFFWCLAANFTGEALIGAANHDWSRVIGGLLWLLAVIVNWPETKG